MQYKQWWLFEYVGFAVFLEAHYLLYFDGCKGRPQTRKQWVGNLSFWPD